MLKTFAAIVLSLVMTVALFMAAGVIEPDSLNSLQSVLPFSNVQNPNQDQKPEKVVSKATKTPVVSADQDAADGSAMLMQAEPVPAVPAQVAVPPVNPEDTSEDVDSNERTAYGGLGGFTYPNKTTP